MKKIILLPALLILASCGPEIDHTIMVENSYNFNSSAVNFLMSSDTTMGQYYEDIVDNEKYVFKKGGDFILNYSDTVIEVADSNDNGNKWTEQRGFEITYKKSGDTLIVQSFPTDKTPDNIMKFGIEYKFYK